MYIIYRISHSSPFTNLRMTCCGALNGKQGSCMTPSMTTIPEKKCVTWKLKFTLAFYFNNVLQDFLVRREASDAFRVLFGVCSLGWRGCYRRCRGCNQGCRGCNQGCRGCKRGCNKGCRGCNQRCRGCNKGCSGDATRNALCILCIQARMCSFNYKDSSVGIPCASSVPVSFIMLAHSHFGLFGIPYASSVHP